MSDQTIWDPPALSAEDQRLIDLYTKGGRPLDDLPYTEEFENLFRQLRYPDTNDARHAVFQRLFNLRKTGRLPRIGRTSAETY